MRQQRQGPTDAERRALQKAVDEGDLRRAKELIAQVRRRGITKARTKPKNPSPRSAQQRTSKPSPEDTSNRTPPKPLKLGVGVRSRGTSRMTECFFCGREISVNAGGRLRAHRDPARRGGCQGSGIKVAKARKSGNSISTVSGGLPGLGKRR